MMTFDFTVYSGYWPFRQLRYAGASGLTRLMARTGVSQALAVPLQGVFYKDCLDGVREMCADLASHAGKFLPSAVVNPNFPGWERDLRTMVEDFGCVACGMLPNYHGYRVTDGCAAALLRLLEQMNVPCLIFIRLWDERSHHWCMQVPPLSVDEVNYLLKLFLTVPMAICNAILPIEGVALAPAFQDRAATVLTTAYKSINLDQVLPQVGPEHLVYGSGAPLFYPESALLQIQMARLDSGVREKILCRNALDFLGLKGGAAC